MRSASTAYASAPTDRSRRSRGLRPALHAAPTASADARRTAEHALRLLLEVLDHRRGARALGSLFSPAMVEVVASLALTPAHGYRLGLATLRQVHFASYNQGSVEVFGTYGRGDRIFAVAAHLELRRLGNRGLAWVVTSVRVA